MSLEKISKRVLEEANIVEIINEVVPLQPKGNNMVGICPFHADKNPSMYVSESKHVFNCFSCGTKGNVISFVSKYDGISYGAATIKLAKKLGIPIDNDLIKGEESFTHLYKIMSEATSFYQFYLKNSAESRTALDYLANRGIDQTIIDKFQIGLAPNSTNDLNITLNNLNFDLITQNEVGLVSVSANDQVRDIFQKRIIFPITNHEGHPVGFSGRVYLPSDAKDAKYINTKETKIFTKGKILYNFYNAAKAARIEDCFYVFEGFMDVIAAEKAGITNGVATMGTAFTSQHLQSLLTITKNIVLCFDGDSAGINALRKTIQTFSLNNLIPMAVILPNGLDPDEYLNKYGREELVKTLKNNRKNAIETLFDYEKQFLNPNDISTIEKFKNSIFAILVEISQKTINDHYLKKLANMLQIAEENIIKDFEKFSRDFYRNRLTHEIQEKITREPAYQTSYKEKYAEALKGIIAGILTEPANFRVFIDALPNKDISGVFAYINRELDQYRNTLHKLYLLLDEKPYTNNITINNINVFFDITEDNESQKPAEYAICMDVITNSIMYKSFNNDAFKQNIETVRQLINEDLYKEKQNRALEEKTPEAVQDFLEYSRKNKKICIGNKRKTY